MPPIVLHATDHIYAYDSVAWSLSGAGTSELSLKDTIQIDEVVTGEGLTIAEGSIVEDIYLQDNLSFGQEVACLPFGGFNERTYISLQRSVYESLIPGGAASWQPWEQVKSFQFGIYNDPHTSWGYVHLPRKDDAWTEGGRYIKFPGRVYLLWTIEWLDLYCPQNLMKFLLGDHNLAATTAAASWLYNIPLTGIEKRRIIVYPRGLLATDRLGNLMTGIEMDYEEFPLASIERWQKSHAMNAGKLIFISKNLYSHAEYQALTTWGNP
jgi:hypothetical protein